MSEADDEDQLQYIDPAVDDPRDVVTTCGASLAYLLECRELSPEYRRVLRMAEGVLRLAAVELILCPREEPCEEMEVDP